MNENAAGENVGGISPQSVVTSGVPVRGPIDDVVKRSVPSTLSNSIAGSAPLNPMMQAIAVQDRLRVNVDLIAEAIEPNHGGSLTVTDFVHLATNHRVQAKVSQANLERLIVALTGGPMNLKLAFEKAAEKRDEEFEKKVHGLEEALLSHRELSDAIMQLAAEPDGEFLAMKPRMAEFPAIKAIRKLIAEVKISRDAEARVSSFASKLDAANANIRELEADLANVRREIRAYGEELAKYRAANDELTRQLDEATKPAAQKQKGGK